MSNREQMQQAIDNDKRCPTDLIVEALKMMDELDEREETIVGEIQFIHKEAGPYPFGPRSSMVQMSESHGIKFDTQDRDGKKEEAGLYVRVESPRVYGKSFKLEEGVSPETYVPTQEALCPS